MVKLLLLIASIASIASSAGVPKPHCVVHTNRQPFCEVELPEPTSMTGYKFEALTTNGQRIPVSIAPGKKWVGFALPKGDWIKSVKRLK